MKRSIVAVSVAFAITAAAQTKAALPEPLLQAIHKAVATNPDVQAKWNAFRAADSQRDVAKAGFLPSVDLSASTGTESRVTSGVDLGSYSVNSAQITLDQILFDGLFTANEVKRLGAAKLTRYYELLDASENAALEAAKAYADVVRYRELVDLATQNYVEHKQSTLLVEERANSGVGRRVDVEQANGRLALAESNLLTELTNLHDVSARYLRVVGEQPAAEMPGLPDPFKLVALPASPQALMLEGMRNSPSLMAALQNARASRLAVDTAKAAYMPRVDLQVYANQGTNAGGVLGDSRATGAAIALTYNLFRGGADKAKEKQAVYLAAQADNLQEKACRDMRQTLSVAYSDTRSLNEQLIYIDQHRLSAEKTREAYRQQFDIGQRTLLDLLDTQNEFFEASRSYINSRHDQAIAQARTLAGIGQLVAITGARRDDLPSPQEAGLDAADLAQTSELCPIEEAVVDSLEKIKAAAVIPSRGKPVPPVEVAMPPPAGADKCGRITLLPDEDGKVGRVYVQDGKGDEVRLETAYAASLDDCQKVTLGQSDDPRYKSMVQMLPAAARYYRIHFALGKDEMLPESATVFKFLLEDFRKAPAPEVTLIGHSDKVGDPATNLKLSQKRAEAVYNLLTRGGAMPNAHIEHAWRGDKEPLPGTEDSRSEPSNRRVEVKIQ